MRSLTIGTFDLLHPGHVRLIARCARLADEVYVAVNTDQFVADHKGQPPIMTLDERTHMVASLKQVSHVVDYEGDTEGVLRSTAPDYLVIGSDWARQDYLGRLGINQDLLDSLNVSLVYVPYTAGVSTTTIRGRIGDLQRDRHIA